jgi:2-dehydropantoate 2-reductase
MGGYFGARLARAGAEVAFIARGASLEALRTRGLTLELRGGTGFTLPVHVTDEPSTVGSVDLLIVAVKTYDLESAAERARSLVGPHTVVLPLQNGIDISERLGNVLGADRVVGGAAYVSATLAAPGVIAQMADPGKELLVGELAGGTSTRIANVVDTFVQAGVVAEVSHDIQGVLWVKYMAACAGALTAMARLPIGTILACEETFALYRGILEETAAVARARGTRLADDAVDRLIGMIRNYAPDTRTSLAYDLEAGRRLELESLSGTLVRLGREAGVPTPLNFAIYAALKPFVDGPPGLASAE